MADILNLPMHRIRHESYKLGLYRMKMHYWTEEQTAFLVENYKEIGDTELAAIFEEKFPCQRKWTKKHIEKKRKYLDLHRTKEERYLIARRNISNGMYIDSRATKNANYPPKPDGTIVYWGKRPYIKVNGEYKQWGLHTWKQAHGTPPKGYVVKLIDGDFHNLKLENLMLITRAENARINNEITSKGLSDGYVASMMSFKNKSIRKELLKNKELLELKRLTLKIQRICKKNLQEQTSTQSQKEL